MANEFKAARGTRDFLPEGMVMKNYVEGVIKRVFESYGFQQIQTPTFEKFSLFSARSGPEIRNGMFTFFCDDEEFALRPELTAAVCRLISSGKLNIPKPYEIYYIGSCFRYERPQSGRYREFTQAGLELMGTNSPMADAKVIAAALSVLNELKLTGYKLKVGNIGIYRDLLANEKFNFDQQCAIIGHINRFLDTKEKLEIIKSKINLDNSNKEFIVTKMSEVYKFQGEVNYSGENEIMPISLENLDDRSIRELMDKIPDALEETIKFKLSRDYSMKSDMLELLFKIGKIKGKRNDIENMALKLLNDSPAEKSLKELLKVLDNLENYGFSDYEVVLGVARGLDFYTGTVFEIDFPILDAQKQVCGGGRYDNLVEEFSGPKTPATGFAFGVDRLIEVIERLDKSSKSRKADFFVIPLSGEYKKEVVKISQKLRSINLKVLEELEEKDLKKQMENAKKLKVKYVILVGEKELESGKLTVINLETNEKRFLKISEIKSAGIF